MLNKIIKILLVILFFTLPLINSHLLDFFGLKKLGEIFYVDGNYEFTKVIYLNIFSSIILFLFFIKSLFNKKIYIPKIIYYIIPILLISTIFSIFPEVSLFGNTDKAHSILMFINLIGIYIILINSDNSLKKTLLFGSVLGLFPIIYFAIKELFFPLFDYGNLKNRAFGFFGHPNYLALYLLLFLPITLSNISKLFLSTKDFSPLNFLIKNNKVALAPCILNFFLIIGIILTIILTKSVLAIFLCFSYLIFYFTKKSIYKKYFIIGSIFLGIISLVIILQNFGYSKLHSFISRFYIWKTSWNIISSDIKTFLIGNGAETLTYIFDNFKSPYLYIFENFGFTADRPHNIFLNIFYHFGLVGLSVLGYLIYKLFKLKDSIYKHSLILTLIFLCFNYASIASYLVIILMISFLNSNNNKTSILNSFSFSGERGYIFNFIMIFLITIFSIIGGYFSYKLYKSETMIYKGNYIEGQKNYIFGKKIYKIKTCEEELESGNKSVETYFYCGDIKYKKYNPEIGIKYYKLGLEKLPDLWNKNSKYYENILIKNNSDILHRFFSKKYSNLEKILKRVGIKK